MSSAEHHNKKAHARMGRFQLVAEGVGFEPTVGLHLRLISSQVHSTTLPPLRWARIIAGHCARRTR